MHQSSDKWPANLFEQQKASPISELQYKIRYALFQKQ